MQTYIKTIPLTRMTNALHVEYHVAALKLLKKLLPREAHVLASAMTEYAARVADEQEHLIYAVGSTLTDQLERIDRERCDVYRLLLSVLGSRPVGAAPEVAALAQEARRDLLRRYTRAVCFRNQAEKTALMGAFLADLQPAFGPLLDYLRMTSVAGRLAELNARHTELLGHRNAENLDKNGRLMEKARAASDATYRAIVTYVGAMASLPVPDADIPTREAYRRLVAEMNEHADYFRQTMRK